MMFKRAISAGEDAGAFAVIDIAKAHMPFVKFKAADIVGRKEDDMVDRLGNGPLTPDAVLVEAGIVARRVDRTGFADHRALGPDAQRDGLAVGAGAMDGAVIVAAHGDFARKAGGDPVQRVGTVHTPYGFFQAIAGEGIGRGQARIAMPIENDARTGGEAKCRLLIARLLQRQAEIGPEPGMFAQVRDPENCALNAQYTHA